jgi:glyoxylase-like metal-dependent hydrolase (beta-lactamase superfamily II)
MHTIATAPEPTRIDHFDPPSLDVTPADELRLIRERAPRFASWLKQTGTVSAFATRALITLPYPRRYGLYEACSLPVPYIWFTNRMFVVQWLDDSGVTRTLLAEPSDYELGYDTPFFRHEYQRMAKLSNKIADGMVERHNHVTGVLDQLGIAPDDVDYITFDHLHTQDIRRIVGTNNPCPELGYPTSPVPPAFPNAKLVVHRYELAHVEDVHPFQARFHQSDTYADIDADNLLVVDGDVLLGPGCALLHTPGHTLGNQTLVVNTPGRGIFTSSENGISVESYAPEHSKIPGVAKWAREWGYEVVMNFNTPEYASWQYNSMIKEKLIADPIASHPYFPQVYPSSELTSHRLAPRLRPTFEHGNLTLGTVRGGARSSGGA